MVAQVVGRLEQRIKDLETQFDEEQRRLVDAERSHCKHPNDECQKISRSYKMTFSPLVKVPETDQQEDQGAHLLPGGGPEEP